MYLSRRRIPQWDGSRCGHQTFRLADELEIWVCINSSTSHLTAEHGNPLGEFGRHSNSWALFQIHGIGISRGELDSTLYMEGTCR